MTCDKMKLFCYLGCGFIGFGPPADFNLGSSAWSTFRTLGQGNLPAMNWGSLSGVHVNSLLHPSLWDSLSSSRSAGALSPFSFLQLTMILLHYSNFSS